MPANTAGWCTPPHPAAAAWRPRRRCRCRPRVPSRWPPPQPPPSANGPDRCGPHGSEEQHVSKGGRKEVSGQVATALAAGSMRCMLGRGRSPAKRAAEERTLALPLRVARPALARCPALPALLAELVRGSSALSTSGAGAGAPLAAPQVLAAGVGGASASALPPPRPPAAVMSTSAFCANWSLPAGAADGAGGSSPPASPPAAFPPPSLPCRSRRLPPALPRPPAGAAPPAELAPPWRFMCVLRW